VSWSDLMHALRHEAGMRPDGHESKPFPLHFEEIRNGYVARTPKAGEASFLRLVAGKMATLQHNALHRRLVGLDVDNVLTTNYDDCLERSLAHTANVDNFDTNESRHSLFRRSRIGSLYFWHIHGDIFRPNSVMLGHDGYVESASRIRRYSDPTLGIPFKAHAEPLKAVFRAPGGRILPRRPHSWVDLLMLRDVHIVGFGLDYTEVDLWYLLSLRQRLRHSASKHWDPLRKTRIVFHHFDHGGAALAQKRELLRSFDVEDCAHPMVDGDYTAAWEHLLRELEKRIGTRSRRTRS
jgi:hypothetical protein